MRMEKHYVVEYYYKVKWGHQDEFLTLFLKNHLPLLKRQVETGRMAAVDIVAPRYHQSEDARWDYRVTITFQDVEHALKGDSSELKKQLYPDQETFKREEQRRFDILDAHWDVPITPVDTEKPR